MRYPDLRSPTRSSLGFHMLGFQPIAPAKTVACTQKFMPSFRPGGKIGNNSPPVAFRRLKAGHVTARGEAPGNQRLNYFTALQGRNLCCGENGRMGVSTVAILQSARGSQTDISDGPRFCQTQYGMNFTFTGLSSAG